MYQVYNKTSTEYAQNAPIVFNTTKFNGVGSSTQATSPFTVALYQNEVALPETTTTVYSTAANDVGALTFSTIVNVLPSCVSVNNQANLQVVATSANSGTMTSANLIIYRLK